MMNLFNQLTLLLQASLFAAALQTEEEPAALLPQLLPLLQKEEADAFQVPAGLTRRAALGGAAATATTFALPALADEEAPVAPPPPPPPPAPKPAAAPADYNLKKTYPEDAKALLTNMEIATGLTRGTPGMEDTVQQTRRQMIDFVSFYRRQPKVAGMPSFSTLYTAVNTLSGHYASYGNKYPVPEKRRTRLQQQYKEVQRALARGK